MNTPLTDQQRELLSAWIDGEITDAERATVETLLKHIDAQQYVESLRATARLVATHAPVRAPVGLSGRVLNALDAEFKPKAVGPGSEPFTAVPVLSWRAPLYAAAAAVLVALGIMFGPALVTPGGFDSVARTPLEGLDGSSDEVVEKKKPSDAVEDKPAMDPAERPSEEVFRLSETKKGGQDDDRSKGAELEKSRKENSKELADELDVRPGTNEDLKGAGEKAERTSRNREPAPSPAKTVEEKPGDSRRADDEARDNAEDDSSGGGTGGKMGGGSGRSAPVLKKADGETRGDGGEKDKFGAPKPPSEPAAEAEEGANDADNKDTGPSGMTIEISDAQTIAAQTDVLWISSLYGDAELTEETAGDVESVAVEIDPAKLPELLAALRKLARDQGYGEVAGGANAAQAAEAREQETGIKGYLPADEPKRETAKSDPATGAEAKVRVVIRLK